MSQHHTRCRKRGRVSVYGRFVCGVSLPPPWTYRLLSETRLKQSQRLGTLNHQNYKEKGMRSTDGRHMLSFLGMLYEIQERNQLQFAFKGRNNSWSWHCHEEPLINNAHRQWGGASPNWPRFIGLHPSTPRPLPHAV